MKNLIVAGIGGQGVNVLTKVLAEVCRASGLDVQYTVHKGGAQSLGTVYGEMRIASGGLPILGASIPKGKLDVLIALDPWEALRHISLAHINTQIWVETDIQPLFTDRRLQSELVSPLDQLHQLPLVINWRHYRYTAITQYGNAKMANYCAGSDCLQALGIKDITIFNQFFGVNH